MSKVFTQALALINNYICTMQETKAKSTLANVKQLLPDHPAYLFFNEFKPCPDLFGQDWKGEDLNGKQLEIFCDHGLGDTVQMFRYMKELKNRYDVTIILNSMAHDFISFLDDQDFIDEVVSFHVDCDYHTNIMQLPRHFHNVGFWTDIIKKDIPPQPDLIVDEIDFQTEYFGLKCFSSSHSELFAEKTIDSFFFKELDFISLEPEAEWTEHAKLGNIAGLASVIKKLPLVLTVDTLDLHLAGSLGIPTIGLLCYNADPRWGSGEITPWYPSVKLFRQKEPENWESVVKKVREEIDV